MQDWGGEDEPTSIPGIGVTKNSREYEEEFSFTESTQK